jgi:hypothetical protein
MPIPAASVADDAAWHDSLDTAAHKAFSQSPAMQKAEQAGFMVVGPDGKYAFSNSVTQNDHDNFALRAQIAKGHKLAGIYHTHPGKDTDGQVFSPHDIEVANQLKVPSYVLFLKDGSVRRYTPGKTPTYHMNLFGSNGTVADGDSVPAPATPVAAPPAAAVPPPDQPPAVQQQPALPPFAAFAATPQS